MFDFKCMKCDEKRSMRKKEIGVVLGVFEAN